MKTVMMESPTWWTASLLCSYLHKMAQTPADLFSIVGCCINYNYIYMHICIYMYTYIYMYMYRERERKACIYTYVPVSFSLKWLGASSGQMNSWFLIKPRYLCDIYRMGKYCTGCARILTFVLCNISWVLRDMWERSVRKAFCHLCLAAIPSLAHPQQELHFMCLPALGGTTDSYSTWRWRGQVKQSSNSISYMIYKGPSEHTSSSFMEFFPYTFLPIKFKGQFWFNEKTSKTSSDPSKKYIH